MGVSNLLMNLIPELKFLKEFMMTDLNIQSFKSVSESAKARMQKERCHLIDDFLSLQKLYDEHTAHMIKVKSYGNKIIIDQQGKACSDNNWTGKIFA
jgi:hypothetical protein